MNYVWDLDGVKVSSITTVRWADEVQPWLSGLGWMILDKDIQKMHPIVFQWEASALPGGWYIIITRPHGKVGETQGATFNLPLEISKAAKRLL